MSGNECPTQKMSVSTQKMSVEGVTVFSHLLLQRAVLGKGKTPVLVANETKLVKSGILAFATRVILGESADLWIFSAS